MYKRQIRYCNFYAYASEELNYMICDTCTGEGKSFFSSKHPLLNFPEVFDSIVNKKNEIRVKDIVRLKKYQELCEICPNVLDDSPENYFVVYKMMEDRVHVFPRIKREGEYVKLVYDCLLYTSPSPRDRS